MQSRYYSQIVSEGIVLSAASPPKDVSNPHAITRAVWKALRPIAVPLAVRSLRRAAADATTVDARLAVTVDWSFLGLSISPWQVRSEVLSLLEQLALEPPRHILEIGTANGGSLFLLAGVATTDAHLISVDLPHGEFGGGYPRWRARLYRSFRRASQRIDLLRGDSHSTSMLDRVRKTLAGAQLDFLFIDGDHSYEGVKRDFEMYSPLVRDGGLIGFHDIVPQTSAPRGREGAIEGGDFRSGAVPEFWRELRDQDEVMEFVDDWAQGCFGIGVIRRRAPDRTIA